MSMLSKLKQFKDLREQGKHMKSMLDEVVVVGKGAHGAVMVTANGSHDVLGVDISSELEREKIAEGFVDAMRDVNKQLQSQLVKKMKDMGGLDAFKNLGM